MCNLRIFRPDVLPEKQLGHDVWHKCVFCGEVLEDWETEHHVCRRKK